MDPIANLAEQQAFAKSLLATWDACSDQGEWTQQQIDRMVNDGYRLATLVESLREWNAQGGF